MIRHCTAALIIVAVAGAVVTPASANGWSFTLTPKGDAARTIGTGLQIYGIARQLRNRAKTDQRGEGNGAAISQSGHGNNALIFQRGKGNSGTVTQTGNYNSYGLFQFGRRNAGHVAQNGNGQVGLTFQGSW
jgi:hypothetical protein